VQQAIGPLMQVWFFASPVAYSGSSLTGWREAVYAANPLVGVIGLARWSLLGAPWPGWSLLVSVVTAAAVLGTGLMYFKRAERSFADVI